MIKRKATGNSGSVLDLKARHRPVFEKKQNRDNFYSSFHVSRASEFISESLGAPSGISPTSQMQNQLLEVTQWVNSQVEARVSPFYLQKHMRSVCQQWAYGHKASSPAPPPQTTHPLSLLLQDRNCPFGTSRAPSPSLSICLYNKTSVP